MNQADVAVLPSGALTETKTVDLDNLVGPRGRLCTHCSAAEDYVTVTPVIYGLTRAGNETEIARGLPISGPGEFELLVDPQALAVDREVVPSFLPRRLRVKFLHSGADKSITLDSTLQLSS